MHVLVTGGCGYVGSVLVPKLLSAGHRVTVVDIQWFGNFLPDHLQLKVLQADIRDVQESWMVGIDAVIHLAAVANDPCVDLDPKLSWEVNTLATMRLADAAVRQGVSQFIYASSGSVYGIKEETCVTEDLPLVPISEYNKTKMVSERVMLSYSDKMIVQILRPATVCGLSPRQRLDLTVNLLTIAALTDQRITVLGGSQTRPNIHIDDMTDLYIYFLDAGEKLQGVFNAGFENASVMEIAQKVVDHAQAVIEVTPSNDPRSYRVDSSKLLATGYRPQKSWADGIKDVVEAYHAGQIEIIDRCYNIKWMEALLAQAA